MKKLKKIIKEAIKEQKDINRPIPCSRVAACPCDLNGNDLEGCIQAMNTGGLGGAIVINGVNIITPQGVREINAPIQTGGGPWQLSDFQNNDYFRHNGTTWLAITAVPTSQNISGCLSLQQVKGCGGDRPNRLPDDNLHIGEITRLQEIIKNKLTNIKKK